jgi:hypothetical protein
MTSARPFEHKILAQEKRFPNATCLGRPALDNRIICKRNFLPFSRNVLIFKSDPQAPSLGLLIDSHYMCKHNELKRQTRHSLSVAPGQVLWVSQIIEASKHVIRRLSRFRSVPENLWNGFSVNCHFLLRGGCGSFGDSVGGFAWSESSSGGGAAPKGTWNLGLNECCPFFTTDPGSGSNEPSSIESDWQFLVGVLLKFCETRKEGNYADISGNFKTR